jgi:segregation and condensation protein A
MPDFLEGVTLHSLALMCAELEFKRDVFLLEAEHVASIPISLESYAEKIQARLKTGVSKTFEELLARSAKREEVIVTFLAVLELYKRGLIDMKQEAGAHAIFLQGLSEQEAQVRGIATEGFDEY